MTSRTDLTRNPPDASGTGPRTAPQDARQEAAENAGQEPAQNPGHKPVRNAGPAGAIDLTEERTGKNPLASRGTPHLPHERDESVGATSAVPSETIRQGYRDLKRGLRDTSRAPEADAAYEKLKK